MSVINTNITAMIGQQNLGKSQSALQTSMERLSSGLRINSAADDAAGQAIANRMTAQTTGLAQAQRNANDGISVAQTAEGALNQVNDNLQRIRELTVQAQNDTNSQSDLNSIQDEIDQRLSEIDRISGETNFNGVKVLAEDNKFSIQVGANDGEQITMNLKEINAETLNLDTFNVNGYAGSLTDVDATGSFTLTASDTGDTITYDTGGPASGTLADSITIQDSEGNAVTGTLQTDSDGNQFVTETSSGDVFAVSDIKALSDGDSNGTADDATITVTVDKTAALGQKSDTPLSGLDSALSDVDSLRSELGAMQNRFDSAINNLSTTETNLSAARSRIEDADYAVEVSNMTRAQILQQAGTSVLAQANQVPQGVLSLLG
ncbi:FliC/FljB family flagellin [Alloalcanivorax profundimaris]|uniref:FliC/FljB family flagellin n=1 Tax=Alloalcanivorax profundimaris TaxID=2735259 RepID=UPI00188922DD|nr:FliC/FljB family flagellin [Alloalcanivorax profundimaris]MBF1800822.1 FliC/FljB family flagellin [Alloalcanivorax profundimaris]MCQ6261726.1 FliC/FljB family flagellin [Alcanivorax sp. MM125-6]